MKIEEIRDPAFLKQMSNEDIEKLCEEIRTFLVQSLSVTGGHLSSNLGIVEITTMLLKVFDTPNDKIIYDVGHQSYVHKILTGRANQFNTLRQFDGLSGFQKRNESIYDCWEAGHSSTSLSAALGMAIARDAKGSDEKVIAVIGDGALNSGMSFEALNHIGDLKTNLIIILNDNEMSITKPIGAFNHALSRMRTSKIYTHSKHDLKHSLMQTKVGEWTLERLINVRNSIKKAVMKDSLFSELGIDYLGPINGHDVGELERAFLMAKEHEGPLLIHILTKKGKGYVYAENDKLGAWHGVGPYDIKSGKMIASKKEGYVSYSEAVCDFLMHYAKEDEKLFVLTPAMISGSKLQPFFDAYPKRSLDCGIAEEHAMTLAASLANSGLHPFISIYSSFLQRAYDQINHDVARMNLPVIVGIDRSGLVGEDGETHHGLFDISILRPIPNVIIAHPKNYQELHNMLYTAFQTKAPFFIRYPRGSTKKMNIDHFEVIPIGSFETVYSVEEPKLIVFTYSEELISVADQIVQENLPIILVNARFIKPIDEAMLDRLIGYDCDWLVFEENMVIGGLGDSLLEYASKRNFKKHIHIHGIEDHFVKQGSMSILREKENIGKDDLLSLIKELIHNE